MGQIICTQCGFVGWPKQIIEGSGCAELLLWLLFIIPGLIYTAYRSKSKKHICPQCKSEAIIPIDSPLGKQKMQELYPDGKQ